MFVVEAVFGTFEDAHAFVALIANGGGPDYGIVETSDVEPA